MTDEFTARRLAQLKSDPALVATQAALRARGQELRPYGLAIVELLHATVAHYDRIAAATRSGRTLNVAEFVWLVAGALGVSDTESRDLLNRIFAEEATQNDGQ